MTCKALLGIEGRLPSPSHLIPNPFSERTWSPRHWAIRRLTVRAAGERVGAPNLFWGFALTTNPVTAVDEWQAELAEAGELTPSTVDRIVDTHGKRGRQAIEAVGERRVKEYRDFTVVVGHREEYVVEDGGCTCRDAEYNLDAADPTQLCWHAIAVVIARSIDAVDCHDMWYSDVREFL